MISFILIGKNIQNTIKLCIDSVLNFVDVNSLGEYEVIYIDSNSKDNSIELAKFYPIKIFQIKGDVNAAIARNIGAKNSNGEILFFLDGDMGLLPDFFQFVFNKTSLSLKYPFMRGYMKEKYYDSDFNFLSNRDENISSQPFFDHVTGGLMIVMRELWEKVGGMDERLIRNQDLDFGLRMSKEGTQVLMDNHYWIIHHTINYHEKNRFASFFKSKALLSSGILMRKHIFNINFLKYYKRNILYTILLVASLFILLLDSKLSLLIFLFYIFIQLLRTVKVINKEQNLFLYFLFKVLYNLYVTIGFLFYYPKTPIYKLIQIK